MKVECGAATGRTTSAPRLGPRYFVVRAVGETLAPQVRDGDHVQVDPDEPVTAGRAVAVRTGESGRAVVLRVVEEDGRMLLRAAKTDVADRVLDFDVEAEILGVAVFAGREL